MMKYLLLFSLFFSVSSLVAQAVGYEVYGVQTNPRQGPYALVTLDTLAEAATLIDVNRKYKPDWISRYLSVKVATDCQGKVRTAESADEKLTAAQRSLLAAANPDCAVNVTVDYVPANNLSLNPPRQLTFGLTVVPLIEAKFPGGYDALRRFIRERTLDQLSPEAAAGIELAKLHFTVDEGGRVVDAEVVASAGSEEADQLLLEAICSMPRWTPAKDGEGERISQSFELVMGTRLLRCDYYTY